MGKLKHSQKDGADFQKIVSNKIQKNNPLHCGLFFV